MQEDNQRESQMIGESKQDKPRRVSLENMAEEEKPFIQEKIKKKGKKRSKGKKFLISLGCSLLFGIIFGIAACAGFYAARPYIEDYFADGNESEEVPAFSFPQKETQNDLETPTDSAVDTATSSSVGAESENTGDGEADSDEENPEKDETDSSERIPKNKEVKIDLTLKDYARLSNQFSSYAQEMEKSVLTVTCVKEEKDIFDHTEITSDMCYGLVLGEYGKELLVLTPFERIKENNKIQVTFRENVTVDAEIINKDQNLGIAILGIVIADIPEEVYYNVEPAKFGESYYLSVGSPVMALGSPNGYMFSREIGSVSTESYKKYIMDDSVELFNTDMTLYSKGEGFAVNLNGEVVGFLTHNFSDEMNQDMCVFMGISKIKKNIEDLINKKDTSSFGIIAWDMTRESLEILNQEKGIYVSEVMPGSAAYNAGIINGDVIIRMGGKEVSSVEDFHDILSTRKPEEEVKVVLLRTAKSEVPTMTLDVILKEKE